MSSYFSESLALTLLHSLWQAAILALFARLLCTFIRRAEVRYAIYCGALVVIVFASVYTFLFVNDKSMSNSSSSAISQHAFIVYGPWIVWAWCSGVAVSVVRLGVAWRHLQTVLQEKCTHPTPEFALTFSKLAERLQITCSPMLRLTSAFSSPCTFGWMRPIVLMPLSLVSRLSREQFEALIAHELAHIRRHDFIANLIQSAIEMLYFFNPGVWWLSREIRSERENCADDLAISLCKSPFDYAQALAALLQVPGLKVPLASSAGGGDLLKRLRRIGRRDSIALPSIGWILLLASMMISLCVPVAVAAHRDFMMPIAQQQQSVPINPEIVHPQQSVGTLTDRNVQTGGSPRFTPQRVRQQDSVQSLSGQRESSTEFQTAESSGSASASGSSSAQGGSSLDGSND